MLFIIVVGDIHYILAKRNYRYVEIERLVYALKYLNRNEIYNVI